MGFFRRVKKKSTHCTLDKSNRPSLPLKHEDGKRPRVAVTPYHKSDIQESRGCLEDKANNINKCMSEVRGCFAMCTFGAANRRQHRNAGIGVRHEDESSTSTPMTTSFEKSSDGGSPRLSSNTKILLSGSVDSNSESSSSASSETASTPLLSTEFRKGEKAHHELNEVTLTDTNNVIPDNTLADTSNTPETTTELTSTLENKRYIDDRGITAYDPCTTRKATVIPHRSFSDESETALVESELDALSESQSLSQSSLCSFDEIDFTEDDDYNGNQIVQIGTFLDLLPIHEEDIEENEL
jgi:hypothetical protein